METLPDVSLLNNREKDEIIVALWKQVQTLVAKVAELEGRLAKNSRNSNKPPSSDGFNKPNPKSLRHTGEKPSGGQIGHKGHTLKQVDEPDNIVVHAPPSNCDVCQRSLHNTTVAETRQVFDLPPLRYEVTEHQVMQVRCACGKVHSGEFPKEVSSPVQYGPAVLAAVVHLTHHHMLPVERTAALMGDLFHLPMSDATVIKASKDARKHLGPTVAAIANALQNAPILHADETGMRVAKSLHWMHVLATGTLTWMARHAKRGKEAFDTLAILPKFQGTLIHDGWKPYNELGCLHGLCNGHHLRELTYVFEDMQQTWAGSMIELLVAACHEISTAGTVLSKQRVDFFHHAYEDLLVAGETLNPRVASSGKRGRAKQSKPTNLLTRLREKRDDVWRFMTDPGVPFTNNVAEQAIRMPKVKQKISGGFRTENGADTFCVIRSYLATLHKQGANLFEALTQTFKGHPPQPRMV